MNKIAASELILNPDGSVYHLNLKPENIAKNIIFVGIALLLYILGCNKGINFFRGLSLIFFLLGVILLLYGSKIYKQLFLPITLLFFAIPIPRIEEITSLLQHFTATWTTYLVSKVGIDVQNVGTSIFFKDTFIISWTDSHCHHNHNRNIIFHRKLCCSLRS